MFQHNEYAGNKEIVVSRQDVFNYQALLERFMGEKELILEVIPEFVQHVKEQLEKLKVSFKDKNFEQLEKEAHSIKGSARNMTADKVGYSSEKLEKVCKEQDEQTASVLINQLYDDFQELIEVLSTAGLI